MEHSEEFHSIGDAHILSLGLARLWMVLVFFAEAIAPSGSRRSTFYHLSPLVSPVVSVGGWVVLCFGCAFEKCGRLL